MVPRSWRGRHGKVHGTTWSSAAAVDGSAQGCQGPAYESLWGVSKHLIPKRCSCKAKRRDEVAQSSPRVHSQRSRAGRGAGTVSADTYPQPGGSWPVPGGCSQTELWVMYPAELWPGAADSPAGEHPSSQRGAEGPAAPEPFMQPRQRRCASVGAVHPWAATRPPCVPHPAPQ